MKTSFPLPQKTCVQEFFSAEFIRSRPSIVAEFMEWHRDREGCAQNDITGRLHCILNSLKVHNCIYAAIHARATLQADHLAGKRVRPPDL